MANVEKVLSLTVKKAVVINLCTTWNATPLKFHLDEAVFYGSMAPLVLRVKGSGFQPSSLPSGPGVSVRTGFSSQRGGLEEGTRQQSPHRILRQLLKSGNHSHFPKCWENTTRRMHNKVLPYCQGPLAIEKLQADEVRSEQVRENREAFRQIMWPSLWQIRRLTAIWIFGCKFCPHPHMKNKHGLWAASNCSHLLKWQDSCLIRWLECSTWLQKICQFIIVLWHESILIEWRLHLWRRALLWKGGGNEDICWY